METLGEEKLEMLNMTQINDIRKLYFEEGLNYAQISRATSFDVKTIKKYIWQEDFNQPQPKASKARVSKLDPFKEDIDTWLEEDKLARKKQRHTARRVFDRLRDKYKEEFTCSYRLVATYVSEKRKEIFKNNKDFYLPLQHIAGEAQVDFGAADFYEQNVKYSGFYLNLSFPFSNGGYLQLFKGENQQCLMEGLKNIFAHIGGVPQRIWFDNMSTAVTKILKDGERELTEAFQRFKNHYGFAAAFCNPNSGHEKGHVENKVGYHRRNLLVPIPSVDNLQEFNQQLLRQCDQDMERMHYAKQLLIKDLFQEDKQHLLPLPAVDFDETELIKVKTNSYAKFTLHKGRHTYSTAPKFAGGDVFVRLTAHEVIVLDENYRQVTKHARLYGDHHQESMDWLPYLTQLSKRPAALKYTGVYHLFTPTVQSFFERCEQTKRKEILRLLAQLSEQTSFDKAVEALETAIEHGVQDTDSILVTFARLNNSLLALEPFVPPNSLPDVPSLEPKISTYDLFLKGGASH